MRLTTKVAVISIASTLALSLTSCSGAGPNAATRMISRVTDGAEAVVKDEVSDIRISNLLLVATEDGAAVVVGHIVNRSKLEDKILGITVGSDAAQLSGKTELLTNQPIHFEGESANAKAVFTGVNAQAGTTVDITIGFARAGLVTVRTIIRDKNDIYSGVISGAKLTTPEAK